jgi:hypothetical protein
VSLSSSIIIICGQELCSRQTLCKRYSNPEPRWHFPAPTLYTIPFPTEYQPLAFDREAAEDAHRQSLAVPASSVSSMSGHSQTSFTGPSVETPNTSVSTSTLSHRLKPGDNPHSSVYAPPPNLAGLGKGHALTPPGSPIHSSAALANHALLSPVPQSPRGPEPATPPAEFFEERERQERGYFSGPSSPVDSNERGFRAMNLNDDGYTTDPGGPGLLSRGNGRRRSLPAVPSDVPTSVSSCITLSHVY